MSDQGRKGTHASTGEALSRSHDKVALALVTRAVEAAPRSDSDPGGGGGPSGSGR